MRFRDMTPFSFYEFVCSLYQKPKAKQKAKPKKVKKVV